MLAATGAIPSLSRQEGHTSRTGTSMIMSWRLAAAISNKGCRVRLGTMVGLSRSSGQEQQRHVRSI
jgi:hypothetical protein